MSISDPLYFLFLGIVFVLYYALRPGAPRRVLLLAASYYFYFELSQFYIVVLLLVTAITFGGAKLIRASAAGGRDFRFFCVSCALILAPLLIFKYLGALVGPAIREHLLLFTLPVGISFFTFAALGYLCDVYLEVVEPELSLPRFALFLAFFPVVSAGPIERAGHFLPQFDLDFRFDAERALLALRLIFVGLLMKVIFADALGSPVDAVYENLADSTSLEKVCAVLYYPFYLYADFAGYSLIAIGSAKLFGLEVRPNFQQPFFSTTIPEFWRTWHISLSSWVRDYLFSPLRMQWRHLGKHGMAAAMFVSFVVLGVWHGARWGFLVYGIIHGIYVVSSSYTLPWRDRLIKSWGIPAGIVFFSRVVVTFFLLGFAFVVFRADNLSDALAVYRGIFSTGPVREALAAIAAVRHHADLTTLAVLRQFAMGFWVIPALILGDFMARRKIAFESFPAVAQVIGYNGGLLMIVAQWLTHYGTQPFVYYKF